MRYAFLDSSNTVVQVIVGELNEEQQQVFLRDYAILFNATQIVAVEDDRSVWIGGSYTDGEFTPAPEPQPEPLPEPQPEPEI